MLDQKFWEKILNEQNDFTISRRKIIARSSNAQHLAKQAIFALQRDDIKKAEADLKDSEKLLKDLEVDFAKNKKLRNEGSWKAGLEEFIEAKLFFDFYTGKPIAGIKTLKIGPEEYIGGLCDTTGEILRSMIIWTTKNEIEKVKHGGEIISQIIAELIKYSHAGYLRTKFDQAKKSLQKSESILYDLSIRDK